MPNTIGHITQYGGSSTLSNGNILVFGPFTAGANGTVQSMSLGFSAGATAGEYALAVYLDASGGVSPNSATLVAKSANTNIPSGAGLVTLSATGTPGSISSGSKYWLAAVIATGVAGPSPAADSQTGSSSYYQGISSPYTDPTPPSTLSSSISSQSQNIGDITIYATYGTSITLSPSSLPNGDVGVVYANGTSETITASGGTSPYTYAVTAGAVPTGLTLSTGGVLSGTPSTITGSPFSFTITATDNTSATGSQAYSNVAINAAISITTTGLPNNGINLSYSQTIQATGGSGSYTFTKSSGTLPTGLTLATTGVLSGTTTATGTFNFTVQCADTLGGTATQSYTIVVTTVVVSPTVLPGGDVGLAYSQTVSASGGTAPYMFSVTSGSLPPGLTLS